MSFRTVLRDVLVCALGRVARVDEIISIDIPHVREPPAPIVVGLFSQFYGHQTTRRSAKPSYPFDPTV